MSSIRAPRLSALTALTALALAPAAAEAADRKPDRLATELPIVMIDTRKQIEDEDKVTARMRIVSGPGTNRPTDRPRAYRGRVGIEWRGTSSLAFPKKQYDLETRERDGDNREVELLGLPEEEDWVLHAPYVDRSMMRNAVAYGTSRMVGHYASRTRYVEVLLNGRYRGVYVLMEDLEIGEDRIDVESDDGTEAFLVERTTDRHLKPGDDPFRLPTSGLPVIWDDPERSELSSAEAEQIAGYVSDFERALYSEEFRDPAVGYRTFLDVPVAIDYILINELFKNHDTFHASFYMHRGAGTLLRFGPVWDFDISSGAPYPQVDPTPQGWATTGKAWWELYQDPAFVDALAARWRELRSRGFVERVQARIRKDARKIRKAARRDLEQWNHPYGFKAEVRFLQSWLDQRAAWIDANIDSPGSSR
jgi:hypothetical protein